jgi:hypothetical protein
MRTGIKTITYALIVPGMLMVLALTFATPERAALDEANQAASTTSTTSDP